MNLPNLPTDNLYKFIALSGVALSISCLGFLIYNEEATQRAIMESDLNRAVAVGRMKSVAESMGQMKELSNKLPPNLDPNAFREFIAPLQEDLEADSEKAIQALVANNAPAVQADLKRNSLLFWRCFLGGGILAGTLISFRGFYLWYYRLQQYQDEIAKNEAIRSRLPQIANDEANETLTRRTPLDIRPKKETAQDHPS